MTFYWHTFKELVHIITFLPVAQTYPKSGSRFLPKYCCIEVSESTLARSGGWWLGVIMLVSDRCLGHTCRGACSGWPAILMRNHALVSGSWSRKCLKCCLPDNKNELGIGFKKTSYALLAPSWTAGERTANLGKTTLRNAQNLMVN